jgi:hypothetical protein
MKNWRKAFGPDEIIQRVRPDHTDDYLNNPHKGTATFQRFNGDPIYPGTGWNDSEGPTTFSKRARRDLSNDRYPPTRVSYCRWLWSVLEPEPGKIRWDILEGALDTAARRQQTLQIRSQPFIRDDTPSWYWNTGAKWDKKVFKASGIKVPDHNDPLYLRHWGQHIRAIGERLDGHPALESVDVAYGGACGECGGNAKQRTAERLVDLYLRAFKKTQLLSMLGGDGCRYASTKKRNFGWRADCFGDMRTDGQGVVPEGLCWNHMAEAYPQEVAESGVTDAWRIAPVVLESCWTVPHWQQQGWNLDHILEQGCKYHLSVFMPKSVYIPEDWHDQIMAFNKRIGYRFHLQQMILPLEAKPGERIEIQTTIDNRGIAPIYRPYQFALRFSQGRSHHIVRSKEDIRRWMPDYTFFRERFVFPNMKRGVVRVSCAIVDEKDQPVVKLAIKELPRDGWHPLTWMDVV